MAICTSQGLLCPNLYTWNMMQSYVLIIVRFCLTSLVIYISLFKATCDNFRRFVLNLYTACVAYETVLIIYTALNVYLLFAEWNLQFAKLYVLEIVQ
ncbi:hypothetical protein Tcan_15928 [Toxocara canis]|uniref:Uncharacterized protein n=1 Tax=Toxocara canis TaxID=6265 RepID=A0A0B2VF62_TOXCA|nr:hypothetical protein Tcan_15928 [Toxocara canis]